MGNKLYLLKQDNGWLDACGKTWHIDEGICDRCGKEMDVLREYDDVLQICFSCLEPANMVIVEETDKDGYSKWLASCVEYGADIVKGLVAVSDACKDTAININGLLSMLNSMLIYTREMKRIHESKDGSLGSD